MPVDQDRYQSLIRRAAFRAEYFRGTIQDLSPAQRAMAFVGAPTWSRINGWPCLAQNAINQGSTSGAVAAFLDVTGSVWFEAVVQPFAYGTDQNLIVSQRTPAGPGFTFFWHSSIANAYARIILYDAAGASARSLNTPVLSVPVMRPSHIVLASINAGATGLGWINGIPVVVTLAGAGVVANAGVSVIEAGGGVFTRGLKGTMIARAWQGTPTNADVACLAEQAKLMIGGF